MTVDDLLALRAQGRQRVFAAHEVPDTADAGYALSAAALASGVGPVTAWKLGGSTPGTRKAFATDVVYFGPVIAGEVFVAPIASPLTVRAPFRGEAEIALRLARTPEPADLAKGGAGLFDAYAPALESPWSVVENLPAAGLPALLMDRCAAGELFLSAARPFDAAALDGLLEIVADGRVIDSGRASTGLVMSPVAAAVEALGRMLSTGFSPVAGQWISTGGITACVNLPADAPVQLRYDGEVVLDLVASLPHVRELA